jgi:hypothetical protein
MIRVNNVTRVELADGAYLISGSTNLRDLAGCTHVARMREAEAGYQRQLVERKVANIAASLEHVPVIDGALIVFVSVAAQPTYNRSGKCFEFLGVDGAIEIVDGQHRFYGAQRYLAGDISRSVRASVQYYVGLDRAAAAAKFREIHLTATRVHAGVLAEAERVAGKLDGWRADVARLYDDVLDGLRFDGRRGVNLRQWMAAVRPHVTRNGALAGLDYTHQGAALLGVIESARAVLGDDVVRRPTVLSALLVLLPEILAHARTTHGNAKRAALASVLEPLRDVNVLSDGRAKDAIVNIMRAAVLPVSLREEDL